MKTHVISSHLEQLKKHPDGKALLKVNEILIQKGYRSLLAGGAVRDFLLNKSPKDLDIATNATPDQIEAIFPHTVGVGKAFGVMRVREFGVEIEVATFRKDGDYLDGRHPEGVTFSEEKEDALRRDFTINGLFLDLQTGEVIDYVGGLLDLQKKELRAIGDAEKRFMEDHLRILRGFRFSSQLGFELNQETLAKAHELSHLLEKVSHERLKDEFEKLFYGEYLELLDHLNFYKICLHLFPLESELESPAATPVVVTDFFKLIQELKTRESQKRTQFKISSSPYNNPWNKGLGAEDLWVFFWSSLLCYKKSASIPMQNLKPFLKKSLQKWRFSRQEERETLASLDLFFSRGEFLKKPFYKKLHADQGRLCTLLALLNPADWPAADQAEILKIEDEIRLLHKNELSPPFVNGDDFKGQIVGAALGEFLEQSYELQLQGKIKTREEALDFFKKKNLKN